MLATLTPVRIASVKKKLIKILDFEIRFCDPPPSFWRFRCPVNESMMCLRYFGDLVTEIPRLHPCAIFVCISLVIAYISFVIAYISLCNLQHIERTNISSKFMKNIRFSKIHRGLFFWTPRTCRKTKREDSKVILILEDFQQLSIFVYYRIPL